MNNLVGELSEIFLNSAKNKFWFGPVCSIKQRKYNRAKKKYNTQRSEMNQRYLQNACKSYKTAMNKYINKYNKENESKL